MSKFPIANALKAGVPVIGLYDCDYSSMINQEAITETLTAYGTAFFDISLPAQLYWTGRKDYYTLGQDFGSLRPPFDHMWLEWDVPDQIMFEGKMTDVEAPLHYGAFLAVDHVTAQDLKVDDLQRSIEDYTRSKEFQADPGWRDKVTSKINEWIGSDRQLIVLTSLVYMMDPKTGQIVFLPYAHRIGIDEQGLFNGYVKALVPKDSVVERETVAAAKELADLNALYLALNLINCRNVDTRASGSVFSRSGREKRQGVPVTRYHTIMLPGMSSAPGGRQSRADRAMLAHHLVRGHFKTFTAERPLLGKHVGTYWWGWQARGSKEHGEVIADYKLGETG